MKTSTLLASFCLSLCISCTTVTPKIVTAESIEFEGNNQDAGFKGYLTDGCLVISSNKVMQYDALIDRYSTNFVPPMTHGFGVQCCYTNGTWLMTKQAAKKFVEMLDIERSK